MPAVLGIDCSTQSLTGTLINLEDSTRFSHAISYTQDARLQGFGIRPDTCTVPPRIKGEADQPPLMYLCALDCLFADLRNNPRIDLADLLCINISAQQHGQIYLAHFDAFKQLHTKTKNELAELFADSFSYQLAPTWMTSNTSRQCQSMIDAYGPDIEQLIGSDLARRYSGVVIKRIAEQFPDVYAETKRIHLISSFLTCVLCGDPDLPIDIGNGAGTGLMDFIQKEWNLALFDACVNRASLSEKLPDLSEPQKIAGGIAEYFSHRYGIPHTCQVLVGSGDNCQTKSMVDGTLLSLGSSFVAMSDQPLTKQHNHPDGLMRMYDGFGKAFTMVCKTNGALVWDLFRQNHPYDSAEKSLRDERFTSSSPLIYRPIPETFPREERIHTDVKPTYSLYPRIVESSLAELAHAWLALYDKPESIYVTGGPSASSEILLRVSALWSCPVIPISDVGASQGAAVVAAQLFASHAGISFDKQDLCDTKSNHINANDEIRQSARALLQAFT